MTSPIPPADEAEFEAWWQSNEPTLRDPISKRAARIAFLAGMSAARTTRPPAQQAAEKPLTGRDIEEVVMAAQRRSVKVLASLPVDQQAAGLARSPRILRLEGASPIFVRSYPDEDCGCPVEEWHLLGVDLILHFEPDGSMEVFADTGDWDHNFPLKASTMEEARTEAFAWVAALPCEG